jgi:hypothetical protein
MWVTVLVVVHPPPKQVVFVQVVFETNGRLRVDVPVMVVRLVHETQLVLVQVVLKSAPGLIDVPVMVVELVQQVVLTRVVFVTVEAAAVTLG